MKRKPMQLPKDVQGVLAPFFPGFDLDRICIFENIPWYVAGKPQGYTDRYNIYFTSGAYRIDSIEGLALIAHEIAHCLQYREHGTWRFRALYLGAYFKNRLRGMSQREAYLNIPFETEAREIEAKVDLALRAGERESGEVGERRSGRGGERGSGRAEERESGRVGERS
jgi:Domain of unknown function (DUF4157)